HIPLCGTYVSITRLPHYAESRCDRRVSAHSHEAWLEGRRDQKRGYGHRRILRASQGLARSEVQAGRNQKPLDRRLCHSRVATDRARDTCLVQWRGIRAEGFGGNRSGSAYVILTGSADRGEIEGLPLSGDSLAAGQACGRRE